MRVEHEVYILLEKTVPFRSRNQTLGLHFALKKAENKKVYIFSVFFEVIYRSTRILALRNA